MEACSVCSRELRPTITKRVGTIAYCKDCFGKSYTVRAVTLPVANVQSIGWKAVNKALDHCFRLSTHAANWCAQQLYIRDTIYQESTPQEVKPYSPASNPDGFYSYGEAKTEPWFSQWDNLKQSLNICLQTAQRKYLQTRYDVMVRQKMSLVTFKYPFPFPYDEQSWKATYLPGDYPAVRLAIPTLGKVVLRLKRRGDYHRQLAMYRQLSLGQAVKGEASLYRDRDRQLLVKLVGYFPKREVIHTNDNVCFLHTDPNTLLVAEVNGRSITITNADHLRRANATINEIAARHKIFLQRASEDKKREVRMDRERRADLNDVVNDRCEKQRDRMHTAVQQIAAQVVRYLQRQRVGLVAYDDSIKTYLPHGFVWYTLRQRIHQLHTIEGGGGWIDGQFTSLNHEERVEWLARARATLNTAKKVATHRSRPLRRSHPAVSVPPETYANSEGH